MRLLNALAVKFSSNPKKSRDLGAATFIITITYVFIGKLALLLALPPGYATAIFPPAGIAVGAAFIAGRSSLPGVFLGSLLLNLWIGYSSAHLIYSSSYIAAALIAMASTLQAGVGGEILRRQLGYPCAFDRARDINLFLMLSPVICLISASVSVASLLTLGLLDRDNAAANWLMWWLGDTMGVLIMLPIVMVFIGKPRSLWRKRRFAITVPMLIAGALVVFAFIQASRWEELESLNYLRTQIGWQSWTVLTLGLFGTGLLGAFLMLSSGHVARVEMEVEQHVKALRTSEERWQFALEGAGDGVWDLDLQTGTMFLSAQNMALLGFDGDAHQIDVEEWRSRIHPDDVVRGRENLEQCYKKNLHTYVFDFRTLTREGQWRWVRSRGKLIDYQPNGLPARMIGTHTDIDSEKHNELKERLHRDVMEMLAGAQGSHKLADVLEKVTRVLREANTDLAYGVFTAHKTYFSMNADSGLPANFRAQKINFDPHCQSGGSAIKEGKIAVVAVPVNELSRQLTSLAISVGYTLCWSEVIKSQEGEIDGVLAAFNCRSGSAALPDLDHLQHAAWLIEMAIQRKYFDEQLQLAASVYEASSEAIMVIDADHLIEAVNPAFTAMTGFSAEEVIGRDSDFFRTAINADAFDAIGQQVDKVGFWQGEFWGYRKIGTAFPISATINTIYDENRNVVRRISIFSDITEKKIAEQKLQHLASHDALTGLPNRVLFRDRIQQAFAFAQRENSKFSLMYIDLDHFKPVNDNLGHHVGDQLLHAAADRMQACVRESDTIARVGGDEFVALLPSVKSAADAFAVAEKIRNSLNQPFEIDGHIISVSASIGIAIYPDDGCNEHDLALCADRAMYLAKQNGRNAIAAYRKPQG